MTRLPDPPPTPRRARMLHICARKDPVFAVPHQNAAFIARWKDVRSNPAPGLATEFRAHNRGA
jgi:hypothetical protein